jgi:hypothetical protein
MDYILRMPLQERLECSSRSYHAEEFGEVDSLVDKPVSFAFDTFVARALSPFLGGRPAHCEETDILHVLAMAIHPQPSTISIRKTANELEEEESETWEATKNLMSCLCAHSFHVNYERRLKLVQLVAEHLTLPEYQNASDKKKSTRNKTNNHNTPLFEGALAHLRASLHAFSLSAMCPYDAHWAQCGLVSIAIQTGMECIVNEEWDNLLHKIVEDRAHHQGNRPHPHILRKPSSFSLMSQTRDEFCPRTARGQLLEQFMTRYNEARHYAEEGFLQRSLGTLSDAVEWQVDCWTKEGDDDEEKAEEGRAKVSDSPRMLAALLLVARPLFYFLLPILNVDDESEEESEESHQRDMLVSSSIQLVHHLDATISRQASLLLVLAFCYGPDEMLAEYVGAVFESSKMALDLTILQNKSGQGLIASEGQTAMVPIESMVATFSQKSVQYADSLLEFLLSSYQLKKNSGTDQESPIIALFRVVAAVATASPVAALKHLDTLVELVQTKDISQNAKMHLIAALLACRRARFFVEGNENIEACIRQAVVENGNAGGWDVYLLARHALVTGNFEIAQLMYEQRLALSTSEMSFLWLSALKSVAEAEASLGRHAAKGIPFATIQLRAAVSSLDSLSIFVGPSSADFTLQMKLLTLRLDFLDLLTVLSQLTREKRLTGLGPAKHTRPSLHLQNVVKCFKTLATKYLTVYRQHGLFICQQSRTSLRSLHALCRFVADAAQSTFIDSLPENEGFDHMKLIHALTLPKGDASHPMTVMIQRLDTLVLKDMDGSVDPMIRAAAALELIGGILKTPVPFPRDFMLTGPILLSSMKLSGDPDSVDTLDDPDDVPLFEGRNLDNEIETSPGVAFHVFASGAVPSSIVRKAKLPFSVVLVWYSVSFLEHLQEDDHPHEEKQNEEVVSSATTKATTAETNNKQWVKDIKVAPTAASLSPTGRFFMSVECQPLLEEGHYMIEARLGCRDIRGGEWELPISQGTRTVSVRVLRARS